jgi:hypothetical protein
VKIFANQEIVTLAVLGLDGRISEPLLEVFERLKAEPKHGYKFKFKSITNHGAVFKLRS